MNTQHPVEVRKTIQHGDTIWDMRYAGKPAEIYAKGIRGTAITGTQEDAVRRQFTKRAMMIDAENGVVNMYHPDYDWSKASQT